jgi:ABC-2 type transport system ATP-binding protein
MIEVRDLSKSYGDKLAVDQLTFTVRPGMVTGFLGPNGAGKSTTMRVILGLDRPTGGSTTVNGKAYRDHAAPLRDVVTIPEATAIYTGRTAYTHLVALAQTHGIPRSRVDEVIALVGLQDVATSGWARSGMGQRLGIAAALLGDPKTRSSTSHPTGSTRKAFAGSATCCARSPPRAARSSSRPT